MPVEDDLRSERGMPRHLDRHMSPLGVHDVKRVMVDEAGLLGDIADDLRGAVHIPDRRRAPAHQDEEHPRAHRVLSEVVLSDLMFTLAPLALDHWDSPRSRPRPHPAGEPPSHPHQMSVVQQLITIAVQPPPPHPKPTRVMTQREVGVDHDPVNTIVGTGQQIPIALAELVRHRGTLRAPTPPRSHRRPTLPRQGPSLPSAVSDGT